MAFYEPLMNLPDQTVVLETDIGGDVDDVGALTLLLHRAKEYGFTVGGISLNRRAANIAEGVRALLDRRGFSDVPIATEVSGEESTSSYLADMAAFLPADTTCPTMTAYDLYRDLFMKAEDGGITIISIGFLQNIVAVWHRDEALFERKVRAIIIMGGDFRDTTHPEYNLNCEGHLDESVDFIEHYPGKVIFCGFECGEKVITDLEAKKDVNDPVIAAYRAFNRQNELATGIACYRRESWDPVTVEFTLRGDCDLYGTAGEGIVHIRDGCTTFEKKENGNRSIVILKKTDGEMGRYISEEILRSI